MPMIMPDPLGLNDLIASVLYHHTHVYLLHAVYCQTLLASQLDFVTQFTRSFYTYLDVIHIAIV